MEVGGLFSDFEAVRTASSDRDAPRRYIEEDRGAPEHLPRPRLLLPQLAVSFGAGLLCWWSTFRPHRKTITLLRGQDGEGLVLVGNSNPKNLYVPKVMLETYRGGVLGIVVSSTDWRNGSASDSSPEGYAFESRIGHWLEWTPLTVHPQARLPQGHEGRRRSRRRQDRLFRPLV